MARTRKGEGQTALVTGASAGIGVDLAECFSGDGYNVILTARRESALREVAGRLANTYRTRLSRAGTPMSSTSVARMGYEAWQDNQRVEITGLRNRVTASLVPFLPRTTVLRIVRDLQSPI